MADDGLRPILYGHIGGHGFRRGLGRQGGLPEALAKHTNVILLQGPTAEDRAERRVRPRLKKVGERMFVVENAFALRNSRARDFLGPLAAVIDGAWLNRALDANGLGDYVYWVSDPQLALLSSMRLDRLVYDCIDPCFVPKDQPDMDRIEGTITKAARLVFATAQTLRDRMAAMHPKAILLPNACSMDTCQAADEDTAVPEKLRGVSRPVIGCLGTYDWRFDVQLVEGAARLLPDCTFALAGRVNQSQEAQMSRLLQLPNVLHLGSLTYEEGHHHVAHFDIGLIPFVEGPMGDAINPVKMYMYLAFGLPVIATDIAECARHADWVTTVRTPEQFAAAVRSIQESNSPAQAESRRTFARQNRWEDRAAAAIRTLRSEGLIDRKPGNMAIRDGVPPMATNER
ncbi:MAG TPA: glycosyltransferase [Chthoniobacter sp.]|nr:glycosyltransferase [Chthoniobacter sp.]